MGADFGSAQMGGALAGAAIGGPKTSTQPGDVHPSSEVGHIVWSFSKDYYQRIHIVPNRFDLGNLLGPEVREFQVWNAYYTSKTCSAVESYNGIEVILIGPAGPFTLGALGTADYSAEIPLNGSPSFETIFTWNFPDESPQVFFTGRRVVVFAWRPEKPVNESLEFLTQVFESINGAEQRVVQRPAPRQAFQCNYKIRGENEISKFDAMLSGWHQRAWGLPIWPELTRHTATIAAGADVIPIDTRYSDYRTGGLAIIWKSPAEWEVVEISTIADDSISTTRPVDRSWSGEKYILPIRLGYVSGEISRADVRPDFIEIGVSWRIADNERIYGYLPSTVYKDIPVITRETLLQGGKLNRKIDKDIQFVDFKVGGFKVESYHDYQDLVHQHLFRLHNPEAAWKHRQFVHHLRGRQGVVWIPSYRRDLELLDVVGSTEVNMRVKYIGYSQFIGSDNELKKNLAFIRADGTLLFREISGVNSGDPGEEIVTIDAALGEEFGPGSFTISFMALHRLASDTVNFKWLDAGRAESVVGFKQVAA